MRLRVILPGRILVDEDAQSVVAEAEDGFFCIEPRHIDYLSGLVPGVLYYRDTGGRERYVAIDGGILVKRGREVFVSTERAVAGPDLGMLQKTVETEFTLLDRREAAVQRAMAHIEADMIRRLVALEKHGK